MLFSICAYAGCSMGGRHKRRLASLKELYTDIVHLGTAIDYKALPVAELLCGLDNPLWRELDAVLAQHTRTLAEAFYAAMQAQLTPGGALTCLMQSDVCILSDFGAALGASDLRAQRANIDYTLKRLNENIETLTVEVAKYGRIYRSLGILGGLAMAIMAL